ncbi:MAG: transglutaminase domain-containing protein [Prevotellaceae bacterium]|jgi:transglutaminase-like putative cysteine protease|nr:transglutaminase domain-containing protein [Prevotellaceae bacterium]
MILLQVRASIADLPFVVDYDSMTQLSDDELARRIALDFQKTRADILSQIEEFFPHVSEEQLAAWEESRALEWQWINDEKRYFNGAARNLFRIDRAAGALYTARYGEEKKARNDFLNSYIPQLTAHTDSNASLHHTVEFTLTVNANAVPHGEVIRCWLPFARTDNPLQRDVTLLEASSHPTLSPDTPHSTVYMEQTALSDVPTQFSIKIALTSLPKHNFLSADSVQPYPVNCREVVDYCREQPLHICFTDAIKALSAQIIGDETNPYLKAKRIFLWINDNIPWTLAREYSTIASIPDYVLENRHGDCGQVTLLFITLCRLNGIPARWQSGFMLYPDAENLHDWAEIFLQGPGWVTVDQSFGLLRRASAEAERLFFLGSQDGFRWLVNSDISAPLFPRKIFPRSETVDFQRGEVEWRGGNLYFDKWTYQFTVNSN